MTRLTVLITYIISSLSCIAQNNLWQKADALFQQDNYRDALEYYQKDLELVENINGVNSIDCVYDLQQIATCYLQLSLYEESINSFTRVMDIIKKFKGTVNKDYYNLVSARSIAYKFNGDYQNSLDDAQLSYEIIQSVKGPSSKEYSEALSTLADRQETINLLTEAYENAITAKKLIFDHFGKSSFQYQSLLLTLNNIFEKTGMLENKCANNIELCESYEASYGELNDFTLGTLRALGHDYAHLNQYDKAINTFSVLVDRLKRSGNKKQLIIELRVLSAFYCDKGDYQSAFSITQDEVSEAKSLNDELQYAASLSWLVYLSQRLNDWDTCLQNEKLILNIYKRLRPFSEEHLMSMSQIAFFYEQKKDYTNKLSVAEELAELYDKKYGKKNDDYLHEIMSIARLKGLLGDYKNAAKLRKDNLKLIRQFYGVNSNEYNTFLHNYYMDEGDADNLHGLVKNLEHLASIRKLTEGEFSEGYLSTLNNLAIQYHRMDYNTKAIETVEKVVELAKQHGETNSIVTALSNAGTIYGQCGDFDNQMKSYVEAYKLCNDNNMSKTNQYASICKNLGQSILGLPEYSELSQSLFLEACVINDSIFGNGHTTSLHSNALSAQWESLYGDKEMAIIILDDIVMHNLKKNNDTSSSFYAFVATELADNLSEFDISSAKYRTTESFQNKDKEALELAKSAYEVRKKIYGENHSATISTYLTLINCAERIDKSVSISYLESYFNKQLEYLRSQLSTMTSKQRYNFWLSNNGFYTSALQRMALNSDNEKIKQMAYDGCLISKGLLLHTDNTIEDIINSSKDDELKEMYRVYLGKKNDILLEKKILNRCAKFGNITSFIDNASWKNIQHKLGANDISIEFSSFRTEKDTTYVAICVTNDKGPSVYKLFDNSDLQHLSADSYYSSPALWELCWGKMGDILKGKKNVYFSPDGILNTIAIECLIDKDGVRTSDKWNMYRLSSTAVLLEPNRKQDLKNLALYGGLAYDVEVDDMEYNSRSVMNVIEKMAYRLPVETLKGLQFDYLYNTKDEVENISIIANKTNHNTKLYTEELGNEETFYSLPSQSINALHFATHGFYWNNQNNDKQRSDNHLRYLDDSIEDLSEEDEAMTRSGLALSGGNMTLRGYDLPAGVEDGILTAKEISTIDLHSCEIVALSACQTGLGDTKFSEGVFGLQRGFKKAGVKSIIMSLWDVNDNATKELMVEFYKNLFNGESKLSALRKAQSLIRTQKQYESPKYWAGFVLLDGLN